MMNIEPQVTGGKPFGSPSASTAIRPAAWRIADAARQLGISRSSLYRMAALGQVRIIKIGGRSVIPDSEVMRLANGEGA
jgi:excisionase family DNA binding protein